jgi:hypothetical protein
MREKEREKEKTKTQRYYIKLYQLTITKHECLIFFKLQYFSYYSPYSHDYPLSPRIHRIYLLFYFFKIKKLILMNFISF